MKRILHLLSTTTFSGAENVVCQIIKMYAHDKQLEMFYCSPNGPIKDVVESEGITFLPIEKLNYQSLNKIIENNNIDVIHAHDIKASVLASCFYKKVSIISHIHTSIAMKNYSLKSITYMLTLNRYKHIYWVSKSTYDNYKFSYKAKEKSTVLYNVIDTLRVKEKSQEIDTNKYDILYVGRLIDVKNPLRLIEIAGLIKEKIPGFQMAIVGDGYLKEKMITAIEKYDLIDNVHMLGFVSNPYPYMANSKVLLMTSIIEGTPMCVLEAMSLGLPIISTPTNGIVDLVDNGQNGYLANTNDELAKAIIRLLTDNQQYKEFAKSIKCKSKRINDLNDYKKKLNISYLEGDNVI